MRWVKVNKRKHTRTSALGLGARVVDQTVARTFKIKRVKGVGKISDNFAWSALSSKFRPKIRKGKVVKEPKVYIEKTKHAIDSLGELQGITVKGWKAIREKYRR